MKLNASTLGQLRAFEAVARKASFKMAAEELHVTQAALSHHVRHLEEALQTPLLNRLHRRIELTQAGAELRDECARAFHILSSTLDRLKSHRADEPLTVSVAPYFSAHWLTPRLGSFWARHPGIELRLHHAYQPADFLNEHSDAGISWGSGHWRNVKAVPVLGGELTPVCSPACLAAMKRPLKPSDLAGHTLFCEFDEQHWHDWLALAGVPKRQKLKIVRIDDSHALRRTALDGHGFALFFSCLIEEDLRSGQLLRPFKPALDTGNAYYLTQPADVAPSPQLAAFTEWLLEEVAARPRA
jgi:DNA-binding transcriptional LysR family regulator